MSMTIGRAAISADPYVGTFTADGDVVSFTSDLGATSLSMCQALSQQLRGLVDNEDEEVVPFTWSLDSSFDGFYRARSVRVEPESTFIQNGRTRFSIVLERVDDFNRPEFEAITRLVTRTNSHAVTTPSTVAIGMGVASGVVGWPTGVGSPFTSTYNVDTEDGLDTLSIGAQSAPLATFSTRFMSTTTAWYRGMAKIEASFGGTYYPLVGQQVPSSVGDNWRLSNGWVRARPDLAGGLWVESYVDGTGWVGWRIQLTPVAGALTTDYFATTGGLTFPIRISRNSPEAATIRMIGAVLTMDLTIRAGDPYIEMAISERNPAGNNWGAGLVSAGAGTSGTGWIRANTKVSGRTFQMSCTNTLTFDTVNTRATLTTAASSTTFAFSPDAAGVGTGGGGGGGVTWTGNDQRNIFLGVRAQRIKVVRR